MNAYSELYLNDAKLHLATMFDYAINVCGFEPDFFSMLFYNSSYAKQFENGNPIIVSGLSGYELAGKIINECFVNKKLPKPKQRVGKSSEYWAGWALAQYQWIRGKSFKSIFKRISLSEIIAMYPIYHEMDISKFIERIDLIFKEVKTETNLKIIREAACLSQAQLAQKSEVNLRNIQMYEQRKNDIDKAQVKCLYRLSKALGCSIEDLLENPI